MISWKTRSAEERALLSPSFCSTLLWEAAAAYSLDVGVSLPFEISFLVLPMVLHRETRESLPHAVSTSLAVWLEKYPLARSHVGERARTLMPFTKDAIIFGGTHGLLDLSQGAISARGDWRKAINTELSDSTAEVRTCARRAEFVGRWLARTGSPGTVMALLGVKP
jgi:hypothetical protein